MAANVLEATLARGLAHEQAVAIGIYAELGRGADQVTPLLAHVYPLVRRFARRAFEQIVGRPLVSDLDAEPDAIRAATKAWLTR